jgi:hypothetical protein
LSLRARVRKLEQRIGADDASRRILVWFGPHFTENWIERRGNDVELHVRTPEREDSPWDFLTPEQCALIRSGDNVIAFGMVENTRDAHSQMDRPPGKRRPHRLLDGGRGWEWQDESGVWRPSEELPA